MKRQFEEVEAAAGAVVIWAFFLLMSGVVSIFGAMWIITKFYFAAKLLGF